MDNPLKADKAKSKLKAPIIGLSKECLHLNSIYEMTRVDTKVGGLLDFLLEELKNEYKDFFKKKPEVYATKFDDPGDHDKEWRKFWAGKEWRDKEWSKKNPDFDKDFLAKVKKIDEIFEPKENPSEGGSTLPLPKGQGRGSNLLVDTVRFRLKNTSKDPTKA